MAASVKFSAYAEHRSLPDNVLSPRSETDCTAKIELAEIFFENRFTDARNTSLCPSKYSKAEINPSTCIFALDGSVKICKAISEDSKSYEEEDKKSYEERATWHSDYPDVVESSDSDYQYFQSSAFDYEDFGDSWHI